MVEQNVKPSPVADEQLPQLDNFSTLGHLHGLFSLAVPFVLSAGLLGEFVGSWFTQRETAVRFGSVSVRKDFLRGIAIVSRVPLLTVRGNMAVSLVTELRPPGEFATLRAARAAGDHGLNSFFVRTGPLEVKVPLELGMTLWLNPGVPSSQCEGVSPPQKRQRGEWNERAIESAAKWSRTCRGTAGYVVRFDCGPSFHFSQLQQLLRRTSELRDKWCFWAVGVREMACRK